MVTVDVRVQEHWRELTETVGRSVYRNLGHAAASIRKAARASLEATTAEEPSPPGQPPRTRKGRRLRRAILYHVDRARQVAVVGPAYSLAGTVGQAHEQGGQYMEAHYPERPFMGPALRKQLSRLASEWRVNIGPAELE